MVLPFAAFAATPHDRHPASHHETSKPVVGYHGVASSQAFAARFSGTTFQANARWGGTIGSYPVGNASFRHLAAGHGYRYMVSQGAYRYRAGHGADGQMAYRGGGGIQCVTFARSASGIELSGNAVDWWDNAAGLYQRGQRPEVGSVLNFRANGRMRMGHVAVVTNLLNSRSVEIDHANWSGPGAVRGGISRAITVVDVSPSNDWTAVRVELGHSEDFGSVYPTFGFIYNRPDGTPAPAATVMAATVMAAAAPVPHLNPAPADLRPIDERVAGRITNNRFDEVAEAPAPKRLDLNVNPPGAVIH